jgi:hypothetical protein
VRIKEAWSFGTEDGIPLEVAAEAIHAIQRSNQNGVRGQPRE